MLPCSESCAVHCVGAADETSANDEHLPWLCCHMRSELSTHHAQHAQHLPLSPSRQLAVIGMQSPTFNCFHTAYSQPGLVARAMRMVRHSVRLQASGLGHKAVCLSGAISTSRRQVGMHARTHMHVSPTCAGPGHGGALQPGRLLHVGPDCSFFSAAARLNTSYRTSCRYGIRLFPPFPLHAGAGHGIPVGPGHSFCSIKNKNKNQNQNEKIGGCQ